MVDREEIQRDLAAIMRNPKARLILSRGGEERKRLAAWLRAPEAAGAETRRERLSAVIRECSRCVGAGEKKFGFGTGENGVMVILNAPHLIGIDEKRGLRNDAISLLKRMLEAAGLAYGQCYLTNVVKCEIRDVLMKPSQSYQNCIPLLAEEIKLIDPRFIIVFGDMRPLQKIVKESTTIEWFSIEHPITILKNPELKRPAWNTLRHLMAKMGTLSQ